MEYFRCSIRRSSRVKILEVDHKTLRLGGRFQGDESAGRGNRCKCARGIINEKHRHSVSVMFYAVLTLSKKKSRIFFLQIPCKWQNGRSQQDSYGKKCCQKCSILLPASWLRHQKNKQATQNQIDSFWGTNEGKPQDTVSSVVCNHVQCCSGHHL